MKKSTISLICAVLWALAFVALLPKFSILKPGWPRIIVALSWLSIVSIQVAAYIIHRKEERKK